MKVWPFKARGPPFTQVCARRIFGVRETLGRDGNAVEAQALLSPGSREALLHLHTQLISAPQLLSPRLFLSEGASSGMGPCGSQELNSSQRQSSSCAGQRWTVRDLSAEVALASSGSAVPRKRSWFNRPREPRKASRDIIGHSPLPTQAFPLSLCKHDPAKILPSFHFHCVPALLQT